MKKSLLSLCLLLMASGAARAELTEQKTVPTPDQGGTIFIITCQRDIPGGLYADTDQHKVGTFGYSPCGVRTDMEKDPENVNQQFAFISYNDKSYLYSVADNRFVSTANKTGGSRQSVTLVEEPSEVYLYENSGVRIAFTEGANSYNINVSYYGGYGGYDGLVMAPNATPDAGNQMVFYNTGKTLTEEKLGEIYDLIDPLRNVEQAKTAAQELLAKGSGAGYPVASARAAFEAVVNKADVTAEEIAEARTAYLNADVNMPEDGKAYKIKAYHPNTDSYTYMTWDETAGHLACPATEPTDGSNVFVCKKHGDDSYALFHANKNSFLIWYADDKKGVGGIGTGLNPNYENGEHDADVWFNHQTAWNGPAAEGGSGDDAELTFGTFVIRAKDEGGTKYPFSASKNDFNFHNNAASITFFHNVSSYFLLEEVENPLETVTLTDAQIEGYSKADVVDRPYAFVVPEGMKAYFVAQAKDGDAPAAQGISLLADENGQAIVKDFAKAGEAVPANTPVLLAHENAGLVSLMPATRETVKSVPDNFTNLIVKGSAEGKPVYSNGAFTTGATGNYYLNIDNPGSTTYELNSDNTSTAISEITATHGSAAVVYDLSGRRVARPTTPGIYIANGRKFIVK